MLRWTIVVFFFASNLYGALPFGTDDVPTVEMGAHELEVEYGFEREEEGIVSLSFGHGLTKRMDFGIGFEYLFGKDSVFTSPNFSFKYNLLPELISISFSGRFNQSPYSIDGIITETFGSFEFDGNCGYSAKDTTITYGIAGIYGVGKFNIGIEFLGNKNGFVNWVLGGRYGFLQGISVSFGVSKEIDYESAEGKIGIHYEF
jgi:hypothetical protein